MRYELGGINPFASLVFSPSKLANCGGLRLPQCALNNYHTGRDFAGKFHYRWAAHCDGSFRGLGVRQLREPSVIVD